MKISAGRPFDELELEYIPPFDWERMLRFFGGRSTGGVETVDNGIYYRTIMWKGDAGLLSARQDVKRNRIIVKIEGEASRHTGSLQSKLASFFDIKTNPEQLRDAFDKDPWLQSLINRAPGLRVPGAWSGFEMVVRTIVGQQVSVKAATTIVGRLVQRAGSAATLPYHADTPWHFPTPQALAVADLDKVGMPSKRIEAVQRFAQAVADGVLDIDTEMPDVPMLRKTMMALKGIGPWTVEYTAMRVWRDTDAWPGTDLVLMQAITKREPTLLKPAHQSKHIEPWRPWRAYAAMHIWNEIADTAGTAKGG